MGLRDLLQKLFGPDPYPEALHDSAPPPPDQDSPAAVGGPRAPTAAEVDPLAWLRHASPSDGVARVLVKLPVETNRAAALSMLRWLRDHAEHPDLLATQRVELADFFAARAEPETAARILLGVARGPLAEAPPAMMRLGDQAAQSGDTTRALGWYESVLALDLEYPGARERYNRLRKPVRAGDAGATLIAPEASVGMGRFELLRELGRGGAGAVYLARDKRLSRPVAFKIYHPQARSDRGARLRGEVQVAASIGSPNVVRVLDLFEELGALVMEYTSGGSLRMRIARSDTTPHETTGWLWDVARALAHTHAKGWVHRDLKPGNVLLRADGRAILTDYGLAQRVGQPTTAMEGTPGYLPPESSKLSTADPRMDVFAFGALIRDLVKSPAPGLASLQRDCLAPAPTRRPANGDELVARLRPLVAG
jgi:serine/threonine-protein kinase